MKSSNKKSHHKQDKKSTSRKDLRKLQSRWFSYAAAGAATAFAGQSADAAVVVDMGNVLPPSQVLDPAGSNGDTSIPTTLALDLDNNGTIDVTLQHFHSQSFYSTGQSATSASGRAGASGSILGVYANSAGTCSVGSGCYHYAVRFSNLSSIGPAHPDIASASNYYLRDGSGFPNSGWAADPSAGFLGVRFDIGGNTHFGFVEVEIDTSANNNSGAINSPTILSYGYETLPNTAIGVPEPSSLGLLALGATGIAALRRRRDQECDAT